jgi:hypothetical protein
MLHNSLNLIDNSLEAEVRYDGYKNWTSTGPSAAVISREIIAVDNIISNEVKDIYTRFGCTGPAGPNLFNKKAIIRSYIQSVMNGEAYPATADTDEIRRVDGFFTRATQTAIVTGGQELIERLKNVLKDIIERTLNEIHKNDQYDENEQWFLYLVWVRFDVHIQSIDEQVVKNFIQQLRIPKPSRTTRSDLILMPRRN